MPGPRDSVADQKRNRRKDTERGREEQSVTKNTETEATKVNIYVPNQLRAKERNRKVKAVVTRKNSDFIKLSDRQNIIDQSQECVEVPNWMLGYPDMENTSLDDAGVDLQSEERGTKPRKLCGARKRLRTPRPQRELDIDSAEKRDSDLQDRDYSSENIPVQNL
ncbi:hypothetical protein Baya_4384 [Bagarius yarrelli]|uniref:Uncharacterized protein n=1 Tax=Bagarius yarrelli TaxID=175774 RepID=A0A556TQ05_BAGYA|nr:hypothetical protein Baya_4384 [Bagarius yarrelli]